MNQFLQSCATGSEPRELVNTCLSRLGDIPTEANFGILYVTDALARELEHIIHLLEHATNIQRWTGTVGIAISGAGHEIYDAPGMALMLCQFPEQSVLTLPAIDHDVSDFFVQQQQWIAEHQPHFGIIHGNPTNPATPDLLSALSHGLKDSALVGGLTSSQTEHWQISDGLSSGGLSGVLFAADVETLSGHTQGCTPIGPTRTITQCERNILISLDNQPAFDCLKEDVGEVLARDLSRLGGYIFAALPIPDSDEDDYTVRNLIGLDPDQAKVAIGELVENGDTLMFCRRDGNTAREDMQRMLTDLQQRCQGKAIKGAVYYSCLGRGRNQFGENSEELQMIEATFGKIPLVGFFANGEIFNNRLYGFTGVLTVFL